MKKTNLNVMTKLCERRQKVRELLDSCDSVTFPIACFHCKNKKHCLHSGNHLLLANHIDDCISGTIDWLEQEADNEKKS